MKTLQVNEGTSSVLLPDGVTYSAGNIVTLSDAQYAALTAHVSSLITLLFSQPDVNPSANNIEYFNYLNAQVSRVITSSLQDVRITADQIDSGVINIERIPLGQVQGTVAAGDDPRFANVVGLSGEVSRAQSAEADLSLDIQAETTRATNAEGTLSTSISAETTRAISAEATKLAKANNLSDLPSPSAARTSLGLGNIATHATSEFDAAGSATSAQTNAATYTDEAVAAETTRAQSAEAAITAATLQKSNNLSDLQSPSAARTALGLGSLSTTYDALGAAAAAQTAAQAYADTKVATEQTRAVAAEVLLAPKASPAFTGTPTAPTAPALNNSIQVATTAYADLAVSVEAARATTAENTKLTKASNLSDLPSPSTARTSLGLGTAATANTTAFDAAGAATAAVATETTRATTAEALLAPKASPAFTGTPTAPTQSSGDNSTKLATTAYADSAPAAAVSVETTRATNAEALLAPKASPALTGTPTAPTATALTNTTQIATTAYADAAVGVEKTRAQAAETLLAPKASPALTGVPTAPTASPGNNSTQIATTAYADAAPGAAVSTETTRATNAEALLAPKASPALTGTPTAPTAAALTNTTQIATTAYADAAVGVANSRALTAEALLAPKASPTFTGTPTVPTASPGTNTVQAASTSYADAAVSVETTRALTAEALKAPLASPALTGIPLAPTATAGTNTTQIATTAFVTAAVAAGGGSSFSIVYNTGQSLTTSQKAQARGNMGSVRAALFSVDDPQWGMACDGVTDDTAGFRALIAACQVEINAGRSATIWNPGLPIGISGPVLVPLNVTLNAPTGTSGAGGAQWVSLGAAAQVFIAGRAGISAGWTMNASSSKPVVTTFNVNTTNASTVWTVPGQTNATLDGLYGKMVYRPGVDIVPGNVTYVVATPGIGGAATGTVVTADGAGSTATGVPAQFGSTASLTIIKPTDRQFNKFAVSNSLADGCLIFTTSNVSFGSFMSESNQGIGLRIDGQAAGAKFFGYTHLGHNGRQALQIRDVDGFARSNGDTTRNISIDLLHIESHYPVFTALEVRSCKGLDIGKLIFAIGTAWPAYANGTDYGYKTALSGRQNYADYGGNYYQVKDGTANFTSSTTSPDLTKFDLLGPRQRAISIMDESASPGNALNIVQLRGTTTVGTSSTIRHTEITLSGDSRSIYPRFSANGQWVETGQGSDSVFLEWNQGPAPIITCTFGTGGANTLLAGTKATVKNIGLGLRTAQSHAQDHNPVTGRDPLYHHYGHALGVENIVRAMATASIQSASGFVVAFPFLPDAAGLTITQIHAALAVVGASMTGVYRFGIGLWDAVTSPTAPVYTAIAELGDITSQVISGTNVGKKVGGTFDSTRGHGLITTYNVPRGVWHAWAVVGQVSSGVQMPKFQGATLASDDALGPPIMAIRLGSQTDLPLPDAPLTFSTSTGSTGSLMRLQGD